MIGPLPPPFGGVATNLEEMINQLKNNTSENVLVLNTSNNQERELINTVTLRDVFYAIKSSFKLLIILIKENVNILHIQSTSGIGFFRDIWFVAIGKLFRKKVILHFHGVNIGMFDPNVKIGKIIYSIINTTVDHLFLLSPYQKVILSKIINPKKIAVIPNLSVINKLTYKQNNFIKLLFLGRLSEQKGFFDLLKAISILKDTEIRFLLYVGGLPPTLEEENMIDNLVKSLCLSKHVKFFGVLSGEKKEKTFSNSDIFILPSYTEKLPVSIFESMGYGLGIITTRVGYIEEYIKEPENCLFVNNNSMDIAQAILRLFNDKKLLLNMKNNNLKKYHNTLKEEIIIDKISDIYSKLINKVFVNSVAGTN